MANKYTYPLTVTQTRWLNDDKKWVACACNPNEFDDIFWTSNYEMWISFWDKKGKEFYYGYGSTPDEAVNNLRNNTVKYLTERYEDNKDEII